MVVCDHASRRIPSALGSLGVEPEQLDKHIAWDIGAANIARVVAKGLNATGVLAGYSRLVVDCNRSLEHPSAFPVVSDGVEIPGNSDLSDAEKFERAHQYFWPYHTFIASRLAAMHAAGIEPVLIAIHSFTPVMNGYERPWQFGVLWDEDPRIPVPLIHKLRSRLGNGDVGDNEPYSGKDPEDFTVDYHVARTGVAHASIEIRQDLVDSEQGANKWGNVLSRVLSEVLDEHTK